jgi:hypothetical protein
MELQQNYHEIRALQFKVDEYKNLEKKADTPEIKMAYSTIQSVHLSTLSNLQTKMVYTISTLMSKNDTT